MIFLFNNEKKAIAEITVLSHDQKMVLNGAITATVTAVYDPEIESAHYFGAKDIDDPNIFWMYRIISQTKENGKITLSGVYLLFDELQGGVIRDIRPQSATPAAALSSILSGSGWQVGTTQTTGTASGSYYYQSRLSAFYDFLQKWNVEFKPRMTFSGNEITGRYIDIYDQISSDYGKRYEYGDKLIHVVAEQANESIYTALIGRGKGEETESGGFGRRITFKDVEWSVANGDPVDKPIGQDYVSIPSAVDTYGFREGVVEFTDTEDPELLLEQTYTEAVYRSRPRAEFKSDVIETGRAELGETVSVIRDNLGIRYKTRIFELNRNFLNKKVKSFKFGDKITATAAERIKEEAKKVEEKIRENQSVMFEALAKITDSYWNEDGFNYELLADNEYNLPAGYYSFDRPIDQDPTKVVYMGAGKVLIADSKNVNDEWAWRTALTPEGLVGSEIIAYSITANQLASDVGQSLDLSSNDSINLIIKDIQVGGENLIRGSQALADKFETYQGSTFTTVSDNMTVPEWDTTTATQVRTTSLGTATLKARWVISNDLAFLADKEMSFSIYAKNNRDNVAVTIGTNRIGEPITLAPLETKRLEYIGVPEGNEGKLLILELHAPTDGHYLDVTLFHPKWELGNIITDWSPHPDEFYAGVTKIDKDGITVAKSNQDINSHLGSNGLVISEGGRDEPGSKAIAGFTDGGAWIGDLKADTIRGDIINTHPGGIINIGSGYNYTSISEALQDMGNAKHLLSDLTFRVYNQLNEDITIRGFTGGMIYIAIMDGGSIHGDIFYYQNASSGYVYGFSKRELLRGSIRASGPSHLFIRGLNIDPNNTSTTAVVTEYGGSAFVMNCDITRCRFGLLAQNGGTITALNNIGLVPGSNAIYNTYNGGVLYARGTMPMGSVKFGGATTGFFYDYTTSQQPSQFQPPTVSPTLITQTFSPTKIETYSHQYGAISSYYPNRAAQNRWDSETGYFEGRITFPGSVRTYINDRNGDTGLKVEMRLRRYSGANGQWSPVAVDKQFTTIGTFSAIDRGNWGNWVQISATLITTSGYTFKFGSQSTGSKYAVWDAAQVRVTKTKNI